MSIECFDVIVISAAAGMAAISTGTFCENNHTNTHLDGPEFDFGVFWVFLSNWVLMAVGFSYFFQDAIMHGFWMATSFGDWWLLLLVISFGIIHFLSILIDEKFLPIDWLKFPDAKTRKERYLVVNKLILPNYWYCFLGSFAYMTVFSLALISYLLIGALLPDLWGP